MAGPLSPEKPASPVPAVAEKRPSCGRGWWKLGADASQDGIDCNIGNAAACTIGTVVKNRPMVWVKASDADKARVREALQNVVLPNWVKRCGPKCGDIYNEVIAPISGVRYAAR